MRLPIWLTAVILCVSTFGFTGKEHKEYQTGTLLDVQSQGYEKIISNPQTAAPMSVRRTDNLVSVRLGDLVLVGECIGKRHFSACTPGDWIVGDPIEVRVEKDSMYLKKPNGKELKTKIVKRVRAEDNTGDKK